jgi:hypothetical protein
MLASCATIGPAPALFPASQLVSRLDFETDALNQPPRGLVARSTGRWAVADSPHAVVGSQVVVRRGDEASLLALERAEAAERVSGEVSVRVLLGPSGAGIACETGESEGFVVKAEPDAGRVALYRRSPGGLELVGSEPAEIRKGEWVRLGIRCEPKVVLAYLDGRAVLRRPVGGDRPRLALYADADVTAQFDDLRYLAK